MPKYHAKLHDLNSAIDHDKSSGLSDLGTGLSIVTATGDPSITFTADPTLATDPVFEIFDRTAAPGNMVFEVDGTGTATFQRDDTTYPGTRDIQGRYDAARVDPITTLPVPDNVWWIDVDGNATFDGNLTIGGSLIGPGIIDTLDELLDPATGDALSFEAYQKSMHLYNDATPGTQTAFFVDQSTPAVTVGSTAVNYPTTIYGDLAENGNTTMTSTAGDTLTIVNAVGGTDDISAPNWSVENLGRGNFIYLDVNSGVTPIAPPITITYPGGSYGAIEITNVGTIGQDISNTNGLWTINTSGSAVFSVDTLTGSSGVEVRSQNGATSYGVDIQNGQSNFAALNISTFTGGVGSLVDLITINNTRATNAVFDITNTAATYDIDGHNHNWWITNGGHIETIENVFANTGRVETPELRFDGALKMFANAAGDMTAQTTDGDFIFDITLGNKTVRPDDDILTDLGLLANRWRNIYGQNLNATNGYIRYLYDVWEIQGDATTPHTELRIDSNTLPLVLETKGANINIADVGLTLGMNCAVLDGVESIKNCATNDLTFEFVDANNIVLEMTTTNGIVPDADDDNILGGDNLRFAEVWADELHGMTLIDSENNSAYQDLWIRVDDQTAGLVTANTMNFVTGTGGAVYYLQSNASLRPFDNQDNDLGATAQRWRNAYVWGNVDGVDTLVGQNGADLTIQSLNSNDIVFDSDSGDVQMGGSNILQTGNIVPIAPTDTYSLGSATLGWQNIYVQNVIGKSPLNLTCDSDPMGITTTAVTGGWARGAGTAHLNVDVWDNLTFDVGGTGDIDFGGAVDVDIVGALTLDAASAAVTSTTGDVTVDSAGAFNVTSVNDISLNPGGAGAGSIDFNNAAFLNVGVVDTISLSGSFCQTANIATGFKTDIVTLDCDQTVAGDVSLIFGATNNKSIIWNQTATRFDINDSVYITGDLYVDGTQTVIDTVNMEVEDNVVLFNRGEAGPGITRGTYLRAGIEVDRGSIDKAGLFFQDTIDRWVCGIGDESSILNPGTLEEIITTDLSQTMKNKTLVDPTIDDGAAGAGFVNAQHDHSDAANGGVISGTFPDADQVPTDTTNFDHLLSAADTDVQLALDTLDAGDTYAIHDNVAGEINAISLKATPQVGDLLIIEDSADFNNKKRITAASLLSSPELGVGTEFYSNKAKISTNAIAWQTIATLSVSPTVPTKFIMTLSAGHSLSAGSKSSEFLILDLFTTPIEIDQFVNVGNLIYLDAAEGDKTALFTSGVLFSAVGAATATNDKVYEVVSSTFTGGRTQITVDSNFSPVSSNEAAGSTAQIEGWSILHAFLRTSTSYEWSHLGRQILLDLPSGAKNYRVSYRSSDVGTTAYLRNMLFSVQKIVVTDF